MKKGSVQRTLKQRAVAFLARREHSRVELMQKLAAHGEAEEIAAVLDQLQSVQLQSDQRFAEVFVRSRAMKFGSERLRQELRQRGVADEDVAQGFAANELPDDLARARAVWQKKFAAPPADAKEWAKQARFLQGRGFGGEIIHRLLKETEF